MVFQRVTLKDIADRTGVHTSTVSRVLNPDRRAMVSSEIAERILGVAEELGYRPNSLAYGLKTNRTGSIGVVVSDISNSVFPEAVQGIEDVLIEAGYTPILANSDHDAERERIIVENMRNQHVDGLIVASGSPHVAVLMACKEDGVPLVLIHRTWDDPDIPSVSYDEKLGANLVIDHLAELGHRDIAYIAGPLDSAATRDRYFGTREALERHGLRENGNLFIFADAVTEEEGERCCSELLKTDVPFTALVTGHDILAAGCVGIIASSGLRIPEDLSLAGYNDTPYATMLMPALTTVHIPHYDGGVEAARLLVDRIENPAAPVRRLRISPTLVIRNSTAPPPSNARAQIDSSKAAPETAR